MTALKIGERVRVVDDYFVEYLRGATGTISTPEPNVRECIEHGMFWVEFDDLIPDEAGGQTEAGAFADVDLQLIE